MGAELKVGTIGWIDLTVAECPNIRAFYEAVVGWKSETVDLGEYSDFSMLPPSGGDAVAGICHARGLNAVFPPQWLIYITVADLEASIERCTALGGKLLVEPRDLGSYGEICVIQDPAGAVCALNAAPRTPAP